jgi:arylsulfatase A-like enzyme
LWSGAVVGAVAGGLLGLWDGVCIVFGGGLEAGGRGLAPLMVALVVLTLAAGATLGALYGLAAVASDAPRRLRERSIGQRRPWGPQGRSWTLALLALAPSLWIARQALSGRHARSLSWAPYGVVGGALALALAVRLVAPVPMAWVARVVGGHGSPRERRLGAALGAALVGLALLVDARVLPGLYPLMHAGFVLLAHGGLSLACVACFGPGLGGPYRGRWRLPLVALAPVAGLGGLLWLRSVPSWWVAANEETVVAAQLARAGAGPTRWLHRRWSAGLRRPCAGRAGQDGPPGSAAPRHVPDLRVGPRLPGHDILLITIDALRADHLGCYGYQRPTSPRIDALAAQSARFRRAYAAVPHTSFSLSSLMTSKYLHALAQLGTPITGGGHETLAAILRQYRYKTAAFFPPAVFFIDRHHFVEMERTRYDFEYAKFEYLPADRRVDQVIQFLESERPPQAFVWIHLFEPHEPYEPPSNAPRFGRGTAMDRYDGEIAWVDRQVGRLVDYFDRHRPGAIIALTADHGEAFGEHGAYYHGTTLFDEQLRVPLLLRVPVAAAAGRVLEPAVSTVDLATTLLSLVGLPTSARMRGQDLSPWLTGGAPTAASLEPVFAETERKKAVALGSDKLICDVSADYCSLYDLKADPGEGAPASGTEGRSPSPRFAQLRALLDQWLVSHTSFEQAASSVRGAAPRWRQAAERAALGDRAAVGELVAMASEPRTTATEALPAVRALVQLAPEPRARSAFERWVRATGALGRWADVGLTRLDDGGAAGRVARWFSSTKAPTFDDELPWRGALALVERGRRHGGDGPALAWLGRALMWSRPQLDPDNGVPLANGRGGFERLRSETVRALGRRGEPAAVAALAAQLEDGTLAEAAATALRALGSRAAVAPLLERLAVERSVSVRCALAETLGVLAVEGDAAVITQLGAALSREQEPNVVAALRGALGRLGRPSRGARGHGR